MLINIWISVSSVEKIKKRKPKFVININLHTYGNRYFHAGTDNPQNWRYGDNAI